MYIYTHVSGCLYIYLYMYIYIYTDVYVSMYVCMYVCMYASMYVCICVSEYLYMHTYHICVCNAGSGRFRAGLGKVSFTLFL